METQKINTTIILAAVALIGVMTSLLVAGLLADYQRVSNAGSIKAVGVGVYSDSACTTNLTSINWGLLTPGTNYTRDIWIKNLGNTRITLSMATEGWSPATASSYITLWWDREGQYLNATQSFKAVLTLYASTTITTTNITDFSFTIVITGTEAT